ncbi:MAG: hypothetical protein KAS17_11510, partial [Victivallaceae bacterium]|nr:hypothetical protein [Victivallaceae bacterium]
MRRPRYKKLSILAAPKAAEELSWNPEIPRPRMILFYECRNVKIEDTSFVDSPCWTIWLIACEQVNIHRVKVIGDQKIINNDGIDIDSCRNVTISDSFLKTGDDCIIIRAIQPVLEKP